MRSQNQWYKKRLKCTRSVTKTRFNWWFRCTVSPRLTVSPKDLQGEARSDKLKLTKKAKSSTCVWPEYFKSRWQSSSRCSRCKIYMENGVAYPIKAEQPFDLKRIWVPTANLNQEFEYELYWQHADAVSKTLYFILLALLLGQFSSYVWWGLAN